MGFVTVFCAGYKVSAAAAQFLGAVLTASCPVVCPLFPWPPSPSLASIKLKSHDALLRRLFVLRFFIAFLSPAP